MADELKKVQEGEKEEETKKAEPTITEDELIKTIKDLEDIIKAGKKPPMEEEEEEDEGDNEDEEDEDEEKSVTGNFEEEETLAKAIEVSDFLAALVDQTEASLDMIADRVETIKKSASKFDEKFIGGLSSIEKVLKSLDERLTKIEHTPVGTAKSVVKSGTVLEKSFNTGGAQPEGVDALPKRKVLELIEKAVAEGKMQDNVLFSYEGSPSGFLTPAQKEILKSYLG